MVPVLMLLMAALVAADEPMMDLSRPAESNSVSVVYCNSTVYCQDGQTCCLSPYGIWSCCLYTLGQCCIDGVHCCPYGYRCDSTSTHCFRGWLKLPSSSIRATKAIQKPQDIKWQLQSEMAHCNGNVYCPVDQFCCKTAAGQWGCCNEMVL
ncbi:hypothetical protein Q8A67_015231 [Cirrhinus molitorella]|uniref:Granulins domain-containing protein n=1 Tax=Cirrhinus molitorella TaxID=172907 RepID=A0AA88PEA0_9TELE|nr:hypothetical protein Q8A67_015231 [Cirrhinus molitorella]